MSKGVVLMKCNLKKVILPATFALTTMSAGSTLVKPTIPQTKDEVVIQHKEEKKEKPSILWNIAVGLIGGGIGALSIFAQNKIEEKRNNKNIDKNTPRFSPKEKNKYLGEIKNEYLQKNPEIAEKWLDKIGNMTADSYLGTKYRFERVSDIKDILDKINEDNQEILDTMLNDRYDSKTYTFNSSLFADVFEIFSECGSELGQKLAKIIEDSPKCAADSYRLKKCVGLIKKYPSESALISDNFNKKYYEKLFYSECLEELLERVSKCSDEEKETIKVLSSQKNGGINNGTLLKFLNANLGLTPKQALTLKKFTMNLSLGKREIEDMQMAKGKPFSKYLDTYYEKPYKLIQKHTDKQLMENELNVLGYRAMQLHILTEDEIVAGINKLKELGLYQKDTNIFRMLLETGNLEKIKLTPETKEFASYMMSNKFIEEGTVIAILNGVQGENSKIIQSKINYAKKLIESNNITYNQIPDLLQNLSSDNLNILNKQVEILSKSIKDELKLEIYSKLLKANKGEFDISVELFDTLQQNKEQSHLKSISSIELIRNLNELPQNIKSDAIEFAVKLLNKNMSPYDVYNNIRIIRNDCEESKQKEFMSLYLKGLENDLGTIKKLYKDLVLIQVADIKKINMHKKLELYDRLTKFNDEEKNILQTLGMNYNELIERIVASLGTKRNLVKISPEQTNMLMRQIIANNNPKAEKIFREFDFAKYRKKGLPLKYSRQEFNANVEELLKDLSPQDAEIILAHFGLEHGEAGFDGLLNNRPFDKKDMSEDVQKAAQKIQNEIEKFTLNNEVMIDDKDTKEVLDGLIKGCPEFTSIVGKRQHGTHEYSVDIHTLKVLQSAMNNPLYKTLKDREKTILKFSILLHDLGKRGGVVDKGHASLSSDYAFSILGRYSLPTNINDKIIDIVDNHHWFENYNTGKISAKDVAVRCRQMENLKIYEIFSKADFENVSSTFHLHMIGDDVATQAEFDSYMSNKFKDIEKAVQTIQENANFIFDTQFMHSGKKFPLQTVSINGKKEKLKVLNMSALKNHKTLEKYGFAPDVTRDKARFFVHMTEPKFANLETVLKLTETPTYQSAWSTSMIQVLNNASYGGRNFGFILSLPQSNISVANFENIGSGYKKDLSSFGRLLFDIPTSPPRNEAYNIRRFVRNNFTKEMNKLGYELNDSEYAQLSQVMFNKKYLSQIRENVKIGDKLIKASDLVSALEKSRDTLFSGNKVHSEIVVLNPKVKGLVARVKRIEDCPQEFLEFAKEHDLPIIMMKPMVSR